MKLDTHAALLPAEGEAEAGDTYVVRTDDSGGLRMVAVIDVLGHGSAAAVVAKTAFDVLSSIPVSSAEAMMNHLHGALKGSRGAAAMLCVFESERVEACGVGNVDLRVLGGRIPVVLSPGILGGRLRKLRVFEGDIVTGTRLLIHTDGISSRFDMQRYAGLTAKATCDAVMGAYRRPHDDATVLVVDAG